MTLEDLFSTLKGSSTSGNYGHGGRPGKEGGSVPKGSGGGSSSVVMEKKPQIKPEKKLVKKGDFKIVPKDDMMNQFSKWADSISDDERRAMNTWQGGTGKYKEMNAYLRANDVTRKHVESSRRTADKLLVANAKTIETVLNRGELKQDTQLFRASSIPALDPKNGQSLVGTKFTDKGFTATTTDRAYAKKFKNYVGGDKAYIIQINAKKGTKGGFMDRFRHLSESEFLMPQGSSFVVTKVNENSRIITVELE